MADVTLTICIPACKLSLMTKGYRLLANTMLLLVTVVWGATFALTKDALGNIPVFPFLALRFILASFCLAVLLLVSPKARKSLHAKTVGLGVLLGIVLFAVYAFQTYGLEYTSPSTAGFLTGLSVILVPILGIWLIRMVPRGRTWLGALLAVAGLALLCGVDFTHLASTTSQHATSTQSNDGNNTALGDILVIACAVFVALQVLLIDRFGRDVDALALATVEIVVLTICCIAMSAVTLSGQGVPLRQQASAWLHPNVIWSIVICAIPGTSLAYWAQNVFQKYTSSAQTAIIFSMEPVFAALVAWFWLGEVMSVTAWIGCALILSSMLIADPNLAIGVRRSRKGSEIGLEQRP